MLTFMLNCGIIAMKSNTVKARKCMVEWVLHFEEEQALAAFHALDFAEKIYLCDYTALTEYSAQDTSHTDEVLSLAQRIEGIAPIEGMSELAGIWKKSLVTTDGYAQTMAFESNHDLYIFGDYLDIFSRVLMGQWRILLEKLDICEACLVDIKRVRERDIEMLCEMRSLLMPKLKAMGWNGNYGIMNEEVPFESRLAYQMLQMIRRAIWVERGRHPSWSRDGDIPLEATDVPLMKVERVRY